MRPDDGWLIFAMGVTLGWVAGWLCHGLYLAARDAARFVVTAGRKLHGWHRARDARRLAAQEGVSATVGAVGVGTFITLDEAGFTLSDRGPYLVSESGVQPVDLKIGKEFDLANRAQMASAVAEYHRGRREVWLSMAATGESSNLTTWILNLRTLTWSGPFVFPSTSRSTPTSKPRWPTFTPP